MTPGQSVPGSNDDEGVFHIPQSSNITGASPWDCLISYPGHCGRLPPAEMQSVYSTAPANCKIPDSENFELNKQVKNMEAYNDHVQKH